MTRATRVGFCITSLALCLGGTTMCRGQALETETARVLPRGAWEFGSAFEFQTSTEGIERALPMAVEYGFSDRTSMLVEPVAYTAIRPKRGPRATGGGDLEATGFYLLGSETRRRPALAGAVEIKFPTTRNRLIGTGQTDVSVYLIASKRAGRFDTHANLGYTFLGQPPGVQLTNTINGALAAEFHLTRAVEVFGEVLGTTSSAPDGGGDNPSSQSVTPEASGGETVGAVGVGVSPVTGLLLSMGINFDNNNAVLLRPAVTWRFR